MIKNTLATDAYRLVASAVKVCGTILVDLLGLVCDVVITAGTLVVRVACVGIAAGIAAVVLVVAAVLVVRSFFVHTSEGASR